MNQIKQTIKGVGDTLIPSKGRGMVESGIFCFLIVAIVAFNYLNIEVSDLLEKIAIGMLTYMVGVNTTNE